MYLYATEVLEAGAEDVQLVDVREQNEWWGRAEVQADCICT